MTDQHKIIFAASAAMEFRSLPIEVKNRIGQAIDALASNPRPPGARKLQGGGNLYRLRVGHYRVVYEIEDVSLTIRVTRVRHRRDVYR